LQKIYFMSKQFSDLGINRELQARLKDIDIIEPTEVQKKVIPFILQRKKDLVALAKTGTGKTAAFGLPLLQLINPKKKYHSSNNISTYKRTRATDSY